MKKELKTASDIISACTQHKSYWSPREEEFTSMYDLMLLTDKLKSGQMESRISNDPITFYNMALHILTPNPMVHKIPTFLLQKSEIATTSKVETFFQDVVWPKIDARYADRGFESFFRALMSPMLVFGWYAVFRMADSDSLIAEVWNPTEVYPRYTSRGMSSVARITSIAKEDAEELVEKNSDVGWNRIQITSDTTLYDFWRINSEGEVENGVVIGTQLAKPMTPDPQWEGVIPIRCGPVNGLPPFNKGKADEWKKVAGRGIWATNKREYFDFNKELTFRQQLLRDTSQPKYWERVTGNKNILTPEKLSRYGSIFTLGSNEEIGILPMHPLPVEMSSSIFGSESRIQRGALPWMLYGNISEQLSSYTMSQVASAANQVLSPYHDAFVRVITEIDNHWLDKMRNKKSKPYGFDFPVDFPEKARFNSSYKLFIPGDVVQRATTMRMMSPQAELSPESTLDMMFPEIGDPTVELAKLSKAKALNNPSTQSIYLISAYRQEADDLEKMYPKDKNARNAADLYRRFADMMEKQLLGQGQEQPTGGQNAGANQSSAAI